ncbi:MAG: HEAT repeat domain-containing protein [Dehalococcoidia bacterium]|nr:HEAT repeat domain-containing protein [Dehalococcoidia bacterium]
MRYLVVAHQTAISPELQREVRAIIARDAAAEFAILVPATPVQHRFAWEDSETIAAARARAAEARAAFERTGAAVVRTVAGGRVPLLAIADELREHPGYDALIIVTLARGVSGWLRADLISQARRRFGLPVTHITAARGLPPAGAPLPGIVPARWVSPDPAVVAAYVGQLRSDSPRRRREAREALAATGSAATAQVVGALETGNDGLRWEAARVLADLHDPASAGALASALMDDDAGVRWLAAEALIAIGPACLLPLLRLLLRRSDSAWLREGVHHVLSVVGSTAPPEVAAVLHALEGIAAPTAVLAPTDTALRALEGAAVGYRPPAIGRATPERAT